MPDRPAPDLDVAVATMMDAAWRPPGFAVPNQDVYPHQWLWDSCFHALVWSALGSDRGVSEVGSALAHQHADGFVPHMTYWSEPHVHAEFWGRAGTSTITQPPMYGHAVAELIRAGWDVPAATVERAVAGLAHLLGYRARTPDGLVPVYHPWETGCDDSLRWDDWLPAGAGDRRDRWRDRKAGLVAAIDRTDDGTAAGSDEFSVGSAGFNALVVWNARELVDTVGGPAAALRSPAEELAASLGRRWDGETWLDDGPSSGDGGSGGRRTLDAMACVLVDPRPAALDALVDPAAYGARFGPRGAHRHEPAYDPDVYWRGPAWPQLTYLLTVAARRAGRADVGDELATALRAGAARSALAEYWNPETGAGLGAVPQTWAGLAIVV